MDWSYILVILLQVERNEHRMSLFGRGDVVTIDKVASSLYHSLVHKFLVWLFLARYSHVEKELVPESGIYQVTGGMFRSAHIEINILPVFVGFLAHQCVVVLGVHISQIIRA